MIRKYLNRLFMKIAIRGEVDPSCLDKGWKLYVNSNGTLCAANTKEWRGWWIITDKNGNRFKATKEE